MSSAESDDDLLLCSIESCFAEVCTPESFADAERGVITADKWRVIEDAGLPLLFVAESRGGLGLSAETAFRLLKMVGRFGAPFPIAETALANAALSQAGLPLADGPAAIVPGGPVQADAGGALLGRAERIAWGGAANTLVVDLDGHVARATERKDVSRGGSIAGFPRDDIAFQGHAEVQPYRGLPLLLLGSLSRSVLMAGALERVLELTIQHVSDRVQFGRPLSKFQAIQQQVALLAGESAAANAAADYAAQAIESDGAVFANAIARARIGEAASRGASIAHQLHGAIGFTQEHMLQRLTRALWTWRDEFGSQRHWTLAVANKAFEADADEYWHGVVAA